MTTICGFEFHIRRRIYHNGELKHTVTRRKVIEAEWLYLAERRVHLAPEKETEVHEDLTIRVTEETIASVRKLGRVEYRKVYRGG